MSAATAGSPAAAVAAQSLPAAPAGASPQVKVEASALGDPVVSVGANPTGVAVSATRAYVANQGSNDVSVIDLTQSPPVVVATIPVRSMPDSVALSGDGSRLYVANFNSGSVSVIDTATDTVSATVGAGTRPTGIVEIGGLVYVANLGSSSISVFDPTVASPSVSSFSVPDTGATKSAPSGLAASADGHTLYANDARNGKTYVFDLTQNPPQVTGSIANGAGTFPAYLSVAGSTGYSANPGSDSIKVLDLTGLTGTDVKVGTRPYGVVALPSLNEVLATNSGSDNLTAIDTSTSTPTALPPTPVGHIPDAIAVSPDHATAVIANEGEAPGTVNVAHVNQPPSNTVPGAQSLVYNGSASTHHQIVFSSGNGNRISTTDPESELDGSEVKITLSVSHGTLTLSQTTNLSFVSGSNPSGSMTFTGQLSDVNAALAGLTYEPTTAFHGTDTLSLIDADQGHSGVGTAQSTTSAVSIDVTDSAPTDIGLSPSSVDENRPVGTTVGTLSTTDSDPGDGFTYGFASGTGDSDNGSFTLSSAGTLQTNASFDFETKSSYSIRVRSTDGGGLSFEKQVTVTINDVNEAPTNIALSNSSINENQPSGTAIGTLSATDPDSGQIHSFTLQNTGCGGGPFPDNGSFQISGSGLQSAASFDFETKSSYTICVRTTDSGSPTLSFDKQFTITINDVNDAPTDISLSNSSINENVTPPATIGTLSAIDQDAGQTHSFNLQNTGCGGGPFNDNNSFQISSSTLQSKASFDFETKSSYTICIRTTDSGSPALSFDKQFTISINDVNDPPAANGDTYTDPVGNTLAVTGSAATAGVSGQPQVPLSAANAQTQSTLIGNDTDQDKTFPHTLSAVAETVTSAHGGTATIKGDGSFTFTPKAGDKNTTDTFTYHVTDGSLTTAGTATIQIANTLVWYVNNALASNGDGRSSSPFNTLSPINGAGGAGDSDGSGDIIFLYQGSGNYTGGLPLEANQQLIGQPQGLNVSNNQIVAAGGSNPAITNSGGAAITLADGNTIQRVNATGASGAGVTGSNVNTLTYGDNTSISGNSGGGLALSGGNGTVNVGAAITTSAGHSVSIANRTGGTTTLSSTISDTGTGITVSTNTGATINLTNTITANTGANTAFAATGGGTITANHTSNTLTTTTGTALNVTSTSIGSNGLIFQSISSNGASNGIVLNTTGASGGLTVTGTGSAGTGGTIQNVVNRGVSGISTSGLSLSYMNFSNDGTVNGADPTVATTTCGDLITGSNTGCNAAIHMDGVVGATLDHLSVSGGKQIGINGNNVTNLTLSNSTVQNAGDQTREDGVRFRDLKGTSSISSSTLQGNQDNQLRIANGNGATGTLNISGSTFQNSTNPNGEYGFQLDTIGTGGFTTTIGTSTFNNTRGGGLVATAQGSSTLNVTASGGTWHGNAGVISNFDSAIQVVAADSSKAKFNVHDISNPIVGYGLNVIHFQTNSPGTEDMQGQVVNTVIGDSSSATSASTTGAGIGFNEQSTSNSKIRFSGNNIRGVATFGITMQMGNLTTAATTVDATVQNNTISVTPAATALQGIAVNSGTTSANPPTGRPADAGTFCADISGNVASSVNADGLRVRQRFATTVRLPGYGGGASDTTAVNSFLATKNPSLGDTISSTTQSPGSFAGGAAGCAAPTLP